LIDGDREGGLLAAVEMPPLEARPGEAELRGVQHGAAGVEELDDRLGRGLVEVFDMPRWRTSVALCREDLLNDARVREQLDPAIPSFAASSRKRW
jgi:hypothetical protein